MDSPPQQDQLKQLGLEKPELEQAIDWLIQKQEAQQRRVSSWLATLQGRAPNNDHRQRNGRMLPHTPPASSHTSSVPRLPEASDIRNKSPSKRPIHAARVDLDETPKVLRGRSRLILQPVSPRKARQQSASPNHSPVKSTLDLSLLEKPVAVAKLRANFGRLPPDIQELVESVEGLRYHRPFMPMEVHSEVSSIMAHGGEGNPKASWFAPAFEEGGKQAALGELGTLLDIRHESFNASKFHKYEAAWNTTVHYPLLKLAFDDSSEQRRADERIRLGLGPDLGPDPSRKPVHIRVENITNATVTGDCVPCLRDDRAPQTADEQVEDHVFIPAWSLHSLSSSSVASSLGDEAGPAYPAPPLALRKTGHKKVDFAIVVDPEPGSTLHKAIEDIRLTMLRDTGLPWLTSMNPSNYGPLREALIAGVVETQVTTASTDPLVQLGLMVAAIHRRLHTLPVQGAAGPSAISKTGVLPPWPLLAITGHRWELYFACDGGSKIVST
ncbi:hypothetical protein DHEL01_v212718 [Diaporthe helianthi]|uniref:PD-(D/E)XK nuclease-like domain-containing protein n=1 Tax=Diaporthe helianthi TaxID=158607 RepID=A0A2P5HF47_DIAHE|nr:hypothetical protein DHEL01_v212718 [Diaporthe helianthi]